MKILILNGSPRLDGNTAAMVNAFVEGARENGHEITVIPVCKKKIAGEDMGIFTAFGKQNKSEEKLNELRRFGWSLRDEKAVEDMNTEKFIRAMDSGEKIKAGSSVHQHMEDSDGKSTDH